MKRLYVPRSQMRAMVREAAARRLAFSQFKPRANSPAVVAAQAAEAAHQQHMAWVAAEAERARVERAAVDPHFRRRDRERRLDPFYQHQGGREFCFACESPTTGVDHAPPLSVVDRMTADEFAAVELVTVACCFDCNRALPDRLLTVAERRQYLLSIGRGPQTKTAT